ncbi:MAG: hypothetical protein JWO06_3857, partial [Bacteroidota bacterium]|nr:hypothetical protein [Bacteroidota bacterium]
QLVVSNRLKFIEDEVLDVLENKIDKIQRSTYNFSQTLKNQKNN